MKEQILAYKDTQIYKRTLVVVRMMISEIINKANINNPTIVFLCDNRINRLYLRNIIDESLKEIPSWLCCGIKKSTQRKIEFKNGITILLELNPNSLIGIKLSNIYYLGSESKIEKFRKYILDNFNKVITLAIIN